MHGDSVSRIVLYRVILAILQSLSAFAADSTARFCTTEHLHEHALLQVSSVGFRQQLSISAHEQSTGTISSDGAQAASPHGTWHPHSLRSADRKVETTAQVKFKIMGQYDSGTHLLRETLVRNFGSNVTVSEPNQLGSSECSFWKHASLRQLAQKSPKNLTDCNLPHTIGVAVIRNPVSWLHSLHSNALLPWMDIAPCAKQKDWLTSSCTYPLYTPDEILRGVTFSSMQEIWNRWLADYESLSSFGFNRNLIVRYEDLVLYPGQVLTEVAALANLTLPVEPSLVNDRISLMHTDGKDEHDRDVAIHKIESKTYLADFNIANLRDLCGRLDKGIMRRHGYTDCDDSTA